MALTFEAVKLIISGITLGLLTIAGMLAVAVFLGAAVKQCGHLVCLLLFMVSIVFLLFRMGACMWQARRVFRTASLSYLGLLSSLLLLASGFVYGMFLAGAHIK